MKRHLIYLATVLLLCASLCACNDKDEINNEARPDAIRLLSAVPIYPGMVEVDSAFTIEAEGKRFNSDASFAEVKRFYVKRLTKDGWQFVADSEVKDRGRIRGERRLEFRQGVYQLSIRYAGERAKELGWDYTIKVFPEE